jgi:hypothetical protein
MWRKGENKDILCTKCMADQEMRFDCIDVFYCIIVSKTTEMVWTCSENGRGKTPKTGYEMESTRKKVTRQT